MNFEYDLAVTGIAFIFFFVLDTIQIRTNFFPESEKNGRYFALHTVCNLFVVLSCTGPLLTTMMSPMEAGFLECDFSGVDIMFALHLYHMVSFRPLCFQDWLHHVIMIGVTFPVSYILQPGTLPAHGTFYASGLPGGIDYAMLVAVKKGWMTPLSEKKYNAWIQQWIRCPGSILHAFLMWMSWVEYQRRIKTDIRPISMNTSLYDNAPQWVIFMLIMFTVVTSFWNGPYFARRVIESHTRHSLKRSS